MVFTERDRLLVRNAVDPGKKTCLKKYFTGGTIAALFLVTTVVTLVIVLPFNGNVETSNDEFVLQAENQDSTTSAPSRFRRSDPTVSTKLGRLNGVKLTSRGGREYFGFYNVPYAEPPLGDLRFLPPVPVKSWSGTRNATVKGTMCTQKSRYNRAVDVEGTEDCLHSNIFTPKIPRLFSRTKYPVIVYFFGGGFMHGTANDFSAAYFMDEDVVIVIVESRVGALGYLNTFDEHATGNQGLKDQVMALKWVQENIADFGGDPKKVVAFGTSSGAICANSHLLSPMSKGLISGVMSFSGVVAAPSMFETNPRETALKFAKAMNCSETEGSLEMMKCLRNVSAHDIALNQPEFSPSLEYIPPDGNLANIFYPDTPLNIMKLGKANNVPWLVGVNSAEAILQSYSFLLNTDAVNNLNNNWDTVAPNLLSLKHENSTYLTQVAEDIREFYFDNELVDGNSSTRFNFTNMLSDRYFLHPTKMSGLFHAQQNNSVYWYYLTKEANVSWADPVLQYFDGPYGVSHADEVQYTFFRERYPYIPLDWKEYADFSVMLIKYWVSFADTGIPENPDPNVVKWPKVDSKDNGKIWYNLDDVPKLVEPFTERMSFWDSFPFNFLYNYDE